MQTQQHQPSATHLRYRQQRCMLAKIFVLPHTACGVCCVHHRNLGKWVLSMHSAITEQRCAHVRSKAVAYVRASLGSSVVVGRMDATGRRQGHVGAHGMCPGLLTRTENDAACFAILRLSMAVVRPARVNADGNRTIGISGLRPFHITNHNTQPGHADFMSCHHHPRTRDRPHDRLVVCVSVGPTIPQANPHNAWLNHNGLCGPSSVGAIWLGQRHVHASWERGPKEPLRAVRAVQVCTPDARIPAFPLAMQNWLVLWSRLPRARRIMAKSHGTCLGQTCRGRVLANISKGDALPDQLGKALQITYGQAIALDNVFVHKCVGGVAEYEHADNQGTHRRSSGTPLNG